MQIKLNDKTYKLKKIKALMVRKSIEITESIDFNKITTKDLDTLIDFIVDLYGNEFTREDVYEGLEAKELLPTIKETMDSVVNGINAEVSKVEKK
jgi:hypothetical protein